MIDTIASLFGYAASALLAISLIVTSALKFRWINALGCVAFIVYGILINAFPIILTNSILFAINSFQFYKLYSTKELFEFVEITNEKTDQLIQNFLSFYHKDILTYFPDYNTASDNNSISFVVLRDTVIANIFVAHLTNDGSAVVSLNYTVPKYRDYKVGYFIFETGKDFLIQKGIKTIVYTTVFNKEHAHFLKVMHFKKEALNGVDCWLKQLV